MKSMLTITLALAFASPAHAALCLPNKTLTAGLKSAYGEVPTATGQTPSAPIVVFTNPDTGSFTVVIVGPESSCIMMMGKGFKVIDLGKQT